MSANAATGVGSGGTPTTHHGAERAQQPEVRVVVVRRRDGVDDEVEATGAAWEGRLVAAELRSRLRAEAVRVGLFRGARC